MTRADLDAQRALFEAWLRDFWTQGYEARKTADGIYQNAAAQNYWVCWQATLASQAPADTREWGTCDNGHHEYIETICEAYQGGLDGEPNPHNYRDDPDRSSAYAHGVAAQAPAVQQEPIGYMTPESIQFLRDALAGTPSKSPDSDGSWTWAGVCESPDGAGPGMIPVYLAAPSPQGDAEDAAHLALQRVASTLRGAGAQLPAPAVKGTIESAMNTGMCVALSIVESEIAAIDAARKAERTREALGGQP